VGDLGLTASEEADPVDFPKILTDGHTKPNPVTPESLARDRGSMTRDDS
jgi:hypothetical protein